MISSNIAKFNFARACRGLNTNLAVGLPPLFRRRKAMHSRLPLQADDRSRS
jgi:hypothetical protein